MKILHTVENYFPSLGGMQEVVKQLSENLVELGHNVTVATRKTPGRKFKVLNGVKIKDFNINGNYVNGLEGEVDKYIKLVGKSKFDIVTNFAAQQWATDALLPILSDIKAVKVFVPTGFSAFYDSAYKKYFINMKYWMKEYDMNIFLSSNYRDINFARKIKIPKNKIMIIPNGASQEEFEKDSEINIRQKLNIPINHFLILHVGSHTGIKGHKEAIKIFKKARIKNSTLLIVGNSYREGCVKFCNKQASLFKFSLHGKIDDKKIVITGLNRKETVAAYKEADLFLFPSNVECSPIVLFEACATKTPFLTSDVGNTREIIEWTNGGKLLPTYKDHNRLSHAKIDDSVRRLENIIRNEKLLQVMAKNGYRSWKKRFTWEKISKQYDSLYRRLI